MSLESAEKPGDRRWAKMAPIGQKDTGSKEGFERMEVAERPGGHME